MKKDKVEIVKGLSSFIVSAGVGVVVRNVLVTTLVAAGGPVNAALFTIGTFAISTLVSANSAKAVNKEIDVMIKDLGLKIES